MSQLPRSTYLLIAITLLCAQPYTACACGGGDSDPSIINSSKESLLHIPSAIFKDEIARLPRAKSEFPATDPEIGKTDQADLILAMDELKISNPLRGTLLSHVAQTRDRIEKHIRAAEVAQWNNANGGRFQNLPDAPAVAVDDRLPDEFKLYLQGWCDYHLGRHEAAIAQWTTLLELPPEKRTYKTVWATYMIGRAHQRFDAVEKQQLALKWFQKTRDLVRNGAKDSPGLASASYGWEARTELDSGNFERAIELYLLHLANGNDSGVASLQRTAAAAFKAGPAALRPLAESASARSVLTAYVVSQGGPWQSAPPADLVRAWLDAIDAADVKLLAGAERLAWSAYQYGHYDLAARWAARADAKDSMVLWILAKLTLRDGKVDEGMKLLAGAARSFPPDVSIKSYDDEPSYHVRYDASRLTHGELGALSLARSHYTEALTLLLKGGYWLDAAYVAERVLTVDELRKYVDQHAAPAADAKNEPPIRYLLARRLLRNGRWKDARPYYSDKHQSQLDAYIKGIRDGHDQKRTPSERAEALWQAAVLIRTSGMELLGTELGPDAKAADGRWELDSGVRARLSATYELTRPSADELQRLRRPPEQLEKRFHYRYVAADHAWAAAALMPDDTEELAELLNCAGGWLKARDPIAADRFYQALVKRCPTTDIGRRVVSAKWFVTVKQSGE